MRKPSLSSKAEKKRYEVRGLENLRADDTTTVCLSIMARDKNGLVIDADPDIVAANSLAKYAGQMCEGRIVRDQGDLFSEPNDEKHPLIILLKPEHPGRHEFRIDVAQAKETRLRSGLFI